MESGAQEVFVAAALRLHIGPQFLFGVGRKGENEATLERIDDWLS